MTNDNTKRIVNIRKAVLVAVLLCAVGGRLNKTVAGAE